MDKTRPIIIIKKKSGHGGHHGGAWKVAYADFVTAMMALFIVLWLLNTSKPVKEAIAGYFKDPSGTGNKMGTSQSNNGENLIVSKNNVASLKEKIEQQIQQKFDKLKDQVVITVTPEGLRIELLESETGTFFNIGSSDPNENGKKLLAMLSDELGKVPNKISIEGHTDSKPYSKNRNYGNWELSSDRANSARRLMQQSGLRADQVSQVRGYADQKLRDPKNPLDPSNRRISVIVHYLDAKPGEAEKGDNSSPEEIKEKAEAAASKEKK
jgi:chemotaxis protein MotB